MRKNVTDMNERCQAFVFDMYGLKLQGRCVNRRHFRIGEKELCGRHAALESMHILFLAGKVKMLVQRMPNMYGAVRTEFTDKRQ